MAKFDINKYQTYVMWQASNPKTRTPNNLSAFLKENSLTLADLEKFMQHENYNQDILRATRFLMINEMPALLWSLKDKVQVKQNGKDLEALYKLVFDPKTTKNQDEAGNVFGDFEESLNEAQTEQIAKRLLNKKNV